MNVPAPATVSPQTDAYSMRVSSTAALAGGTPLAILSVMLWENHYGAPLNSVQACAVGSCGAAVFAYFWHVATSLISRHFNL